MTTEDVEMKRKIYFLATLGILLMSTIGGAQSGGSFTITKSVIAGGGGNSTGGTFVVDGTAGQSAAGTTSTGGTFQVTGGFWGGSAAPSSSVSVSGRVTTPAGLGLRNAIVSLIDAQGIRRLATTSAFGVYTFDQVGTGQTYTVTVTSKRFRFSAQFVSVQGTLTNVDFTGLE
jgi:hypothetical protein